jgi:hypothetical protein
MLATALVGVTPAGAVSTAAASTVCEDNTNPIAPGSTVNGNVVVNGGTCTLNNVRVKGNVTVNASSLFYTSNGTTIDKNLNSTGADYIEIHKATIKGNATFSATGSGLGSGEDNSSDLCGSVKKNLTVSGTGNLVYWTIGTTTDIGGACESGATFKVGGNINYDNNQGGGEIDFTKAKGKISCNNNDVVYLYQTTASNGFFGQCDQA